MITYHEVQPGRRHALGGGDKNPHRRRMPWLQMLTWLLLSPRHAKLAEKPILHEEDNTSWILGHAG